MKKQKNIIKIGEDFVENKKYNMEYFDEFKKLECCYARCSYAKQNIYNYYYTLLVNNCDNVINYGVRSYNSMIIVLHAIVEKEGKKLYLVITPSHNWYSEI